MKPDKILRIALITVFLMPLGNLIAQEEFKSDVKREYDEDGNLIHYDSCYTWSFRGGHGFDFDSVFNVPDSNWRYARPFRFPDSSWVFGPHPDFPGHFPEHFFRNKLDSIFAMPFSEPFFHRHDFPDFFEDHTFHDIDELFERHMERMQEFFHHHSFPEDSIRYHQPAQKSKPGHQKKSFREIEI